MKNVTITLDDAIASRARVEAANQGKSLSKFVRELIEREFGINKKTGLEVFEEFLNGPGYPGISKNWRGREELYAERENELLRRHERANLHPRSKRSAQESVGGRSGGADDQEWHTDSKSTKPE
jgi:hypothetical protein